MSEQQQQIMLQLMGMKVYWGWIVCLSSLLLYVATTGVVLSFGEILIPLNKEMNESVALLEWIGSLPVSLALLLAPLGTYMNYKCGTRCTVLIGVFLVVIGLALTAVISSVWHLFLFYGLVVGMGLILIINPPFFLLDEYFPYDHPRHVLATSVMACGFPLATLISNPLTYVFLEAVQWRKTYLIFASMSLVIGIPAGLTFRNKYKQEIDMAHEEILPNTGMNSTTQKVTVAKRTKIIAGTLVLLSTTLKSIGYYTPFFTLVKQMDVMGIAQSQASKAMTVVGACELVCRLLTSYLGDYIKGKILFLYIACTLALCVQNIIGSFATSFTHLLIYGVCLGIFGGPVIAAMYSSCFEVIGGHHVHALFTTSRVGIGAGILLGPTIAGSIFDNTNSFMMMFYVSAVTYFTTSLLYAVIILLNKYQPRCCFPDPNEESTLVTGTKPGTGFGAMDNETSLSAISESKNAEFSSQHNSNDNVIQETSISEIK